MLCVFHYNLRECITLGSLKPKHPAPGLSRVKGGSIQKLSSPCPREKLHRV